MTASRTCRACGTTLSPDVSWCLCCYEPVRGLTPREPQLPTLPVPASITPPPRTSRWRKGPTTFGPVGRLTITALLLMISPLGSLTGFGSPAGAMVLWWLLGWSFVAALVLRQVWRREEPLDDTPGLLDGLQSRHPLLGRRVTVPPLVVAVVCGLTFVIGITIAWVALDTSGRYYLVAIATVGLVAVSLARWNEL